MNDNTMQSPRSFQQLTATRVAKSIDLDLLPGDCGLIIRRDGSLQTFSTAVSALPREALTEDTMEHEARLIENGRTLTALVVALQNPQILTLLHNVAAEIEVSWSGE